MTSPPILLSKGEEAVLHIFNNLYNYHFSPGFLLITFASSDYKFDPHKSEGCVPASPLEGI
jgi:hypothetical protein